MIDRELKKQLCHKCRSLDYFMKFCLLWILEYKKNNSDKVKEARSDHTITSNRSMATQQDDLDMKKAFTAMENSSEEESEDLKINCYS